MNYKAIINRRTFLSVSAAFLISTLDLFLTCLAINSGMAKEINPLLSNLTLQSIGLLKVVGLLVLVGLFYSRPRIINLVTLVMLMVCVWNTVIVIGYIMNGNY